MKFIAHRINTTNELKDVPIQYGIEIDLRDFGKDIVLAHDPFVGGERLSDFLKHYHHQLLILNIKSERIEWQVLEMIQAYGIEKYVFLDSTFPMIYGMSQKGEQNIALRYSEIEGLDTLRAMAGRVKYVWVDCFNSLPLNQIIFEEIIGLGYKIIVVSPELQSQPEKIATYIRQISSQNIVPHYVCSKIYNIPRWEKVFGILG